MLKMFSDLIVGETFIIGGNGYFKIGFNTAVNTRTKNIEYFYEQNILVNACKNYKEAFQYEF